MRVSAALLSLVAILAVTTADVEPAADPAAGEPAGEPAGESAAAAPPTPVSSGCVMWRQTGGCSPTGPREDKADLPCDATVPGGASGYCECDGGRRVRESTCEHEPFSCAHECLLGNCVGWRQTANCDPDGDRLPDRDLDCSQPVPESASGFCECAGGRIVAKSGCHHASFTCAHACHEDDHEELEWDSHPIRLTDTTFTQVVSQHDIVMVNFYVDWCRYCTMLKPVYAQAAKLLKREGHSGARFATVDCLADDTVVTRGTFEVNKYPTLKVFRKGKLLKREFRGQRTARNLVNHVAELLKDPIAAMPPVTERGLLAAHTKAIIAELNGNAEHFNDYSAAFRNTAEALRDDCSFGMSTTGADTVRFKSGSVDTPYQFPDAVGLEELKSHMFKWASEVCNPLVRELTFANGEEITEEGIPILVVFYDPANPTPVQEFTAVVQKRFQAQRGRINFVTADGTKFSHPLRHLGKTKADLPIIAVDTFKHMFLFKSFDKIRRAGPLERFVKKLHSGELHRNYHSPVPVNDDHDDDYYSEDEEDDEGQAKPVPEKAETLKEKLEQAKEEKLNMEANAELIQEVEAIEEETKQRKPQRKPQRRDTKADPADEHHDDDDEEILQPVPISSVLNKLRPSGNRYSFERNRDEL
eukprot:m.489802 g.489802  ORF g.489802 m.489802 type:complete len:643 (-) comp27125_c0_seq1:107-2035(-)